MVFAGRAVRRRFPPESSYGSWPIFYTGPSGGSCPFHRPAAGVPSLLAAFTWACSILPRSFFGMDGAILAALCAVLPAGAVLQSSSWPTLKAGPLAACWAVPGRGRQWLFLYQLLASVPGLDLDYSNLYPCLYIPALWPCLDHLPGNCQETKAGNGPGRLSVSPRFPGFSYVRGLRCMGIWS